jgi:hypothetical protein
MAPVRRISMLGLVVRMGVCTIVIASSLAACSILVPDPPLSPGTRQWIIRVQNASGQPAALFVAEDLSTMGRSVGTAVPSTVPAGATQDVVFTVPPGRGWAIFVNPGPTRGPLILAQDVPPNASGVLGVFIQILPDGEPVVSAPGRGEGWFGN